MVSVASPRPGAAEDPHIRRNAFEGDAGGRQQAGMRRYRILRPTDDDKCVLIAGDFDTAAEAEAFLHVIRTKVWSDPGKAPAKIGMPQARIVELVETKEY